MDKEEFLIIVERISDGSATDAEIALYLRWYELYETDEKIWSKLGVLPGAFKEALFNKIQSRILDDKIAFNENESRTIKLWPRLAAALSIVLCVGLGIFYYSNHANKVESKNNQATAQQKIVPGSNKAILTLGDGKQVELNGDTEGKIADQGNVTVNKTSSGQLIYQLHEKSSAVITGAPIFNQITVPRGGQYEVILPDGSKVFLNAATTLKYPAAFLPNERKVELSGEAYFEVSKDQNRPFKVNIANKQEVEVLGTHFNIAAYQEDGLIKTTLFEGAVKLKNNSGQVILKPGQMTIGGKDGKIEVSMADLEQVLAWKKGLFVFNDQRLEDVMKMVCRWYDTEVVYKDEVGAKKLWGTVSKYKTIEELLDKIAFTSGIHYKIEGRRVVLTK